MTNKELRGWAAAAYAGTVLIGIFAGDTPLGPGYPTFLGFVVATYLFGKSRAQTGWWCLLACLTGPLGPAVIAALPNRTTAVAPGEAAPPESWPRRFAALAIVVGAAAGAFLYGKFAPPRTQDHRAARVGATGSWATRNVGSLRLEAPFPLAPWPLPEDQRGDWATAILRFRGGTSDLDVGASEINLADGANFHPHEYVTWLLSKVSAGSGDPAARIDVDDASVGKLPAARGRIVTTYRGKTCSSLITCATDGSTAWLLVVALVGAEQSNAAERIAASFSIAPPSSADARPR